MCFSRDNKYTQFFAPGISRSIREGNFILDENFFIHPKNIPRLLQKVAVSIQYFHLRKFHSRLHATVLARIVRIGRYERGGDQVDERKHGEIWESSLLFRPFSSAKLVAFSVNTMKQRHIVSLVMAGACLSRCSHSMVDEIYRVCRRTYLLLATEISRGIERNSKEKF